MKQPNRNTIAKFLAQSNRIEGVHLPPATFHELLTGTTGAGANRHVLNSVGAWRYILQHRARPVAIEDLYALHRIQMGGLMRDGDEAGRFRSGMVLVGSHTPPAAQVIHYHIDQWLKDAQERSACPFQLHYEFETIHPYWDGNGRVGRLLWAWQRLFRGERVKPILGFYEGGPFLERRSNYYRALMEYNQSGKAWSGSLDRTRRSP